MPGLVAVPAPPAAAPTTAAPDANTDTLTQREIAQAKGFSGNICTGCGGFNLKQSGHCEVCDDCGTTTGCS
jgi:ribonucleoside-diphosphate reductase alpha chain